jgi:hypothetical protein
VHVWSAVWHRLLREGGAAPWRGVGRRCCGGDSSGCCRAVEAPSLGGTLLPCELLPALLLRVPPPLGCAGAAEPEMAVRELLLGWVGRRRR